MNPSKESVRVIRGPLNELRIYDVSELELDAIERGGTESIYLNLALSLGSAAGSFAFSLLTTKIESRPLFDFFVIVAVLCGLSAGILAVLWRHEHTTKKNVIDDIRKRIPALGEQMPSEPTQADPSLVTSR